MRTLLAVTTICLCAVASAQAPYANPVIKKPAMHAEVPDPFVLKWNGEYYLYTSGDPITAYHSADLVNWTFIGPVLSSSKDPNAWNGMDVWAPEVVYRDGKFYMSYTAAKKSDDWRVQEMTRRIGVAVSDSPRGPFVDSGKPLTPGWGIDSHVFRDPDSGDDYLFYSYFYEPRHPGAGIVVDRMRSMTAVAGSPTQVTRGSFPWEDKDGDWNNGTLRFTNEAPTVLKRFGRYYMFYSGGSWDLPTYSLAYATADKVQIGDLEGPGWKKAIPPILRSTPLVDAPGHNALTKAPNNVDDVNVYHARTVPFLEPWNRLPFVERLYWNHERPHAMPPSRGLQPAPERPLFADNFNRADAPLGAPWRADKGEWQIVSDQLRQNQRKGEAIAQLPTEKLTDYVFEVNLRLVPGRPEEVSRSGVGDPRGAAGVVIYEADPQNRVTIWLDVDEGTVVADIAEQGQHRREVAKIPARVDPKVYHQLLVTRNGRLATVMLDGVVSLRVPVPGAATPVALTTRNTRADFDGIALTDHYEDAFDTADSEWQHLGGSWTIEEGAMHQVQGGAQRSIALRGAALENYEVTASTKFRDSDAATSKTGVVAAATDNEVVLASFDRTIWPFARFSVQHVVNNQVKSTALFPMPRGFDHNVFHTLRVVKQGSAFTFFLDGRETAAAHIPIGAARSGVFTEGARADFDVIARKRLVVPQNLLLNASFEAGQAEGTGFTAENPWVTSGVARSNYCCAHSGDWRVLIMGGEGSAAQAVPKLPAGKYTLVAFATTRGAPNAELQVRVGGQIVRAPIAGESWRRYDLNFSVPEGAHASIQLSANAKAGSDDFVAADDFYLYREAESVIKP
jgi:GH43 family beta-xylosidase